MAEPSWTKGFGAIVPLSSVCGALEGSGVGTKATAQGLLTEASPFGPFRQLITDMRPELVGNPVRQILHGGVISATLDVVGGLAIALASITRKAEEMPARHFPDIGTIDLRIDYLRPGRGHYFVIS
jgi:Thioesterase superfamily